MLCYALPSVLKIVARQPISFYIYLSIIIIFAPLNSFFIAAPFLLYIALLVAYAALIFLRVSPILPSPRRLSNNLMAFFINPPFSPLNINIISLKNMALKRKRRAIREFLVKGDFNNN